jgi:hypothetical protein
LPNAKDLVLVTHPNYSEYTDGRSKVRFTPTVARNADGHRVIVAQATVERHVAEEFFTADRGFICEEYTPAQTAPFIPSTQQEPAQAAAPEVLEGADVELPAVASEPSEPASMPIAVAIPMEPAPTAAVVSVPGDPEPAEPGFPQPDPKPRTTRSGGGRHGPR